MTSGVERRYRNLTYKPLWLVDNNLTINLLQKLSLHSYDSSFRIFFWLKNTYRTDNYVYKLVYKRNIPWQLGNGQHFPRLWISS